MPGTPSLRAVIYVRLSVSAQTSVSIERQIDAARQYATARGWSIVAEPFVDDGVSASKNAPEKRPGWKALLEYPEPYDAVVIWKIDRLARSTLDFLNANRTLQERGAGVVAVNDPIDMTSAQGRAFATVLAVFAELESAIISERVAASRTHMLRSGRVVGGTVPYGWQSVPNPDGPGRVLRRDPDRIEWVRGMVERCQRGDTLYMITQWLDREGAPLPSRSQSGRTSGAWRYITVERLLRNPVLAGMTPFNPGNKDKERGTEVLRDERGLPVVDPEFALMPLEAWRAMVKTLDERDSPQSRPRALKTETSPLFSGLIYCADDRHDEPQRMWRSTTQGREGYSCPKCSQTISNFEDELIQHFLEMKGDWVRWSKVVEVYEGGADDLPEIEHRLQELDQMIREAPTRGERSRLRDEQDALLDLRDQKRQEPGAVVERWSESDHYFSELWAAAGDEVIERRAVLEDALERVLVRRGRPGRRKAGAVLERLTVEWKRPDEVGPRPHDD